MSKTRSQVYEEVTREIQKYDFDRVKRFVWVKYKKRKFNQMTMADMEDLLKHLINGTIT